MTLRRQPPSYILRTKCSPENSIAFIRDRILRKNTQVGFRATFSQAIFDVFADPISKHRNIETFRPRLINIIVDCCGQSKITTADYN